jgi:curved DNA-binding protein
MEYIDYYKVLDVGRDASSEEITKAYKRLARKYHPDLNKDEGAEAQFKQINEAYEVLKNPESRKRYDMLGANWKHGSHFEPPPGWAGSNVRFNFGGAGGGGFSDFFESIFGGMGSGGRAGSAGFNMEDLFGGAGFGGMGREPARGRDVESTLTVDLEDVYHGNKRTVAFEGPSGRKQYDLTIPRGISDGEKIRLSGQGEAGAAGRGDLYLTVKVRPHAKFRRDGDDLIVTVPVAAWDAGLGAKIPVPTMDSSVTMKLPAGQASGKRLRLRGKGMPRRKGGHGDLYAEIQITVPTKLTDEQKRLFEQLRDTAQ